MACEFVAAALGHRTVRSNTQIGRAQPGCCASIARRTRSPIMASSNTSGGWREKWAALPPKRRQQITTFGALGAVLVFAFVLISGGGGGPSNHNAQEKIANELLTKESARDLGITGVAKDVDNMRLE